eukprot:CAMPEP_0168325654 /NCGR_PEP_ID=MMETSP0213-20121227/4819_1 /TAXON_ID=151035 /ORGANISM="Euplotes harpa, Strain FSP1.4" /LENGTH=67 /DNA_ID=CAMNT_0008328185 /DNA_START=776 /DNA_END=976 /DNA_ORIENTATION=+
MDLKLQSTPIEEMANEVKTSQYIEISNKNLALVKEAVDMIIATVAKPAKGLEKEIVDKLKEEQAAQK